MVKFVKSAATICPAYAVVTGLAAGLIFAENMFGWELIQVQLIGIAACAAWTFTIAWSSFKLVAFVVDLRVSTTDEQRGLDFSEHHEVGYPEFQATLHN